MKARDTAGVLVSLLVLTWSGSRPALAFEVAADGGADTVEPLLLDARLSLSAAYATGSSAVADEARHLFGAGVSGEIDAYPAPVFLHTAPGAFGGSFGVGYLFGKVP